jgi:antitoxin component of RelBE/YafQ-DinJ toxin-antitoxin module
MNTAILNIKTDPETKERLKGFAAQVGLPVSALLNAQIKEMLRNGRVEFSTTLEPTPYLQKIIKEAEADYAAGKNITRVNTKAELKKYLDSI